MSEAPSVEYFKAWYQARENGACSHGNSAWLASDIRGIQMEMLFHMYERLERIEKALEK